MRRAFPEFAADGGFVASFLDCSGRRCRAGDAVSFPYRPKIGGKSAHALRGNLQHDRCDEKKESGAQLSGERARHQTTNDSANRSADSNESKKPFGLLRRENVSHERPKHCRSEKIEDADPNEKYGRKD